MKVFVDAGHGGADSGAVGAGARMEKHDALDMAISLRLELIRRGHTVMMSRIGDSYPSLAERAETARAWRADALVSLHRCGASADVNGAGALYAQGGGAVCCRLAEEIAKRLCRAAGFKPRGARKTKTALPCAADIPCVTVEAGFVTSRVDNAKYDAHFYEIVCAVADAIEDVLDEDASVPTGQDGDTYITQRGAKLYRLTQKTDAPLLVRIEDYSSGGEYAEVSDCGGNAYLVKWAELKKA